MLSRYGSHKLAEKFLPVKDQTGETWRNMRPCIKPLKRVAILFNLFSGYVTEANFANVDVNKSCVHNFISPEPANKTDIRLNFKGQFLKI